MLSAATAIMRTASTTKTFCTLIIPSDKLQMKWRCRVLFLYANHCAMGSLSKKHHYIQYIVYLIFVVCAFGLGAMYYIAHNSGLYFSPQQLEQGQESVLLDDEGVVWARFHADQ